MGLVATKSISFLLGCLFHVGRFLCSNLSSTLKWVTSSITKEYYRFFAMESPFFSESMGMCLLRVWSTTVMTVNLSAPISPILSFPLLSLTTLQNFSETCLLPLTFPSPFDVPTEASAGNGELYLDRCHPERSAARCSIRGCFWGTPAIFMACIDLWLDFS